MIYFILFLIFVCTNRVLKNSEPGLSAKRINRISGSYKAGGRKLLVREMRNKQKRIRLNRDFFPSKQFNEMEAAEKAVDKELESFTNKEQEELPFKETEK